MLKIESFFESTIFYWLPIGFYDKIKMDDNSEFEYSVVEWGFWSFLIYKIN
jgi:hypothetical protein